jgi:hypothetical protein
MNAAYGRFIYADLIEFLETYKKEKKIKLCDLYQDEIEKFLSNPKYKPKDRLNKFPKKRHTFWIDEKTMQALDDWCWMERVNQSPVFEYIMYSWAIKNGLE